MIPDADLDRAGEEAARQAQAAEDAAMRSVVPLLVAAIESGDIAAAMRLAAQVPSAVLRALGRVPVSKPRDTAKAAKNAITASDRVDSRDMGKAARAMATALDAKGSPVREAAACVADEVEAFARRMNLSMASDAAATYREVVTRLIPQVASGRLPKEKAVEQACVELARRGVATVDYRSGRREAPDSVMRRHVRTQLNQAGLNRTLESMERTGTKLVYTTVCGDARPSHREWQGKVFALNGPVTIDGVTYRDLRAETGAGKVDGLGGVNCHHKVKPYYPGITELPKERDYYNGRDPEESHRATQRQRRIEREIRKAKQGVLALEEAGADTTRMRLSLGRAQERMRKHLAENPWLRRYPDRERVFTKDGVANVRALKVDPDAEAKRKAGAARESMKRMAMADAKRRIEYGKFPLKVKKGSQEKHVPGSNGFIPSRGEIRGGLVAAKALIKRYSLSGVMHAGYDKKGVLQAKEVCQADGIIGVWRDSVTGESSLTDRFTIHYSAKGTHIVPAKPSWRLDNGSH